MCQKLKLKTIMKELKKNIDNKRYYQGECIYCGDIWWLDKQGFCDPTKGYEQRKDKSRACKAKRIMIKINKQKQAKILLEKKKQKRIKEQKRRETFCIDVYGLGTAIVCGIGFVIGFLYYC